MADCLRSRPNCELAVVTLVDICVLAVVPPSEGVQQVMYRRLRSERLVVEAQYVPVGHPLFVVLGISVWGSEGDDEMWYHGACRAWLHGWAVGGWALEVCWWQCG